MVVTLYLIIFIFGVCLGSFLNCVIYRLNSRQNFLKGFSICPNCQHKLGFFDLIPILSFIILRGKCRYCKEKISFQYPLVEFFTGIIFIFLFWRLSLGLDLTFGFWILDLLYLLIVACFLVIIFVYDLKHYIIPDKIIYPAIVISLIFNFQFSIFNEFSIFNFQKTTFCSSLLTGLGAAGFFFLIWLLSRGKWMGFGDVKLAFLMGLFLGFPNILVALFSAFFIGAIIGISLIVLNKKTLKSQVPFGPFLVAGTFIALFWGEKIIDWYLHFI